MKKTITLALAVVLTLISLSFIAQAEESLRFVTIQEWLGAKGECGSGEYRDEDAFARLTELVEAAR